MSYGFQVFNNNGNVLIDTLAQSQMQITEVTTHASSGASLTRGAGEVILWSTQHTSGGTYTYTAFSQGAIGTSNANTITNNGPASSVVRLRDVTQATVPTRSSSNQYGIETYNANNVVSYSDLFVKSYTILAIYPPGTITDGDTIYTGSTAANQNVYVGSGFTWYDTPSSGVSVVWGNFRITSTNITFQNHISITGIGGTAFPNFSTVVVLKIRN